MSKKLGISMVVLITGLVVAIPAVAQEIVPPAQQPNFGPMQDTGGPAQNAICTEELLREDFEKYLQSCGQGVIPEPTEDSEQAQPEPGTVQPPTEDQTEICTEELSREDPEAYAQNCEPDADLEDGEPGDDAQQPGDEPKDDTLPQAASPADTEGESPAAKDEPQTAGTSPREEAAVPGAGEENANAETVPQEAVPAANGEKAAGKGAAGKGAVRKRDAYWNPAGTARRAGKGAGGGDGIRKQRKARKGGAKADGTREQRRARKDANLKGEAYENTAYESKTIDEEPTADEETSANQDTVDQSDVEASTPSNSRVPLLLGAGTILVSGGGLVALRFIR